MTITRFNQLLQAVVRTHEVDESGDASLLEYVQDTDMMALHSGSQSVESFLEGYLVWANGPNWEQFLATAKVGDVPPKE